MGQSAKTLKYLLSKNRNKKANRRKRSAHDLCFHCCTAQPLSQFFANSWTNQTACYSCLLYDSSVERRLIPYITQWNALPRWSCRCVYLRFRQVLLVGEGNKDPAAEHTQAKAGWGRRPSGSAVCGQALCSLLYEWTPWPLTYALSQWTWVFG